MCGIIGYVGKENAAPILIEGLKRLEYRGYDSVGIAVLSNSTVLTLKTKGRIADLKRKLEESGFPQGNLGLGHTRWATHGEPSEVNSHPHTCGKVTLVHNGIIENYAELKARLAGEGRSFVSGTDTEIVAHLIDRYYSGDPAPAIFRGFRAPRFLCPWNLLFRHSGASVRDQEGEPARRRSGQGRELHFFRHPRSPLVHQPVLFAGTWRTCRRFRRRCELSGQRAEASKQETPHGGLGRF